VWGTDGLRRASAHGGGLGWGCQLRRAAFQVPSGLPPRRAALPVHPRCVRRGRGLSARPMLPSLLLILLIVSLGTCGSARTVGGALGTAEGSPPAWFGALGEGADERTSLVTLEGGRQVRARALRLTAEEATWIDPETGRPARVAAAEVVRVEFVSQESGAGLRSADALGALSGIGWGPCAPSGSSVTGPPASEGRGGGHGEPLSAPRVALADAARRQPAWAADLSPRAPVASGPRQASGGLCPHRWRRPPARGAGGGGCRKCGAR
jgi:hypothetical protein